MAFGIIAVISPGNMGGAVGKMLGQNGYEVITCLAGRGDFTRSKAADAGIRDAGSLDALAAEADLVLSIIDPAKAVMVAGDIADAMRRTGATPVYADCNATSPQTATEIQRIIAGAGGKFIDIGIIGAAPTERGDGPIFHTSGPDAALIDELDGKGVKIVNVGDEIGQGSAVKICNAAWTKGSFALYTAVMAAAEHYGFTEYLRPRLPGGQAGTVEKIDRAVTRLPADAGRYIGEMEQIAETLSSIGLPSGFHTAAGELFGLLNKTPMASEHREEIDPNRSPLDTLRVIVDTLHRADTLRRKE